MEQQREDLTRFDDDIATFERIAGQQGWPREVWPTQLSGPCGLCQLKRGERRFVLWRHEDLHRYDTLNERRIADASEESYKNWGDRLYRITSDGGRRIRRCPWKNSWSWTSSSLEHQRIWGSGSRRGSCSPYSKRRNWQTITPLPEVECDRIVGLKLRVGLLSLPGGLDRAATLVWMRSAHPFNPEGRWATEDGRRPTSEERRSASSR